MHLDLTVRLGDILTIAGMTLAVFVAYTRLRERLISIETQLGPLWKEFTERRTIIRRVEDRS